MRNLGKSKFAVPIVGLSLALLWASVASIAGGDPLRAVNPIPFPPGETMTFHFKWKPSFLIPSLEAGDITIRYAGRTTFGGRPALRVEAAAVSTSSFKTDVRDYFISLFSPGDFQSLATVNLLQEGDDRRQQTILYDPEARALWLKETCEAPGREPPRSVSRNELHGGLPAPLHDPAAMVTALRVAAGLDGGATTVHAGYLARVKEVTVEELGTETVRCVLGEVSALKYNVRNLFGNIMDPGDSFLVWTTPDARRIPLRVKAKVKHGYIEGELTRYAIEPESIIPDGAPWMTPLPESTPPLAAALDPRSSPLNPLPTEMVRVPGGVLSFGAGSRKGAGSGKPVTVGGFYMDRTEVTNREYKRFVDATKRTPPDVMSYEFYRKQFGYPPDGYEEYVRLAAPFRWKDGDYPSGRGDYPVVLVTWGDAAAYAEWAGKRLPTEAEWEWAARGGEVGRDFPWVGGADPARANTAESDILGLAPVGSYERGKNGYGLYDMCGNAGEWASDWYSERPVGGGERDPEGPSRGVEKVVRGGSWKYAIADATVWARGRARPDMTHVIAGFRCARD